MVPAVGATLAPNAREKDIELEKSESQGKKKGQTGVAVEFTHGDDAADAGTATAAAAASGSLMHVSEDAPTFGSGAPIVVEPAPGIARAPVAPANPEFGATAAKLEVQSDAPPVETYTANGVETAAAAAALSVEPTAEPSAAAVRPATEPLVALCVASIADTPASFSSASTTATTEDATTTTEDGEVDENGANANVAGVDFAAIVEALGLPDHIPELLEISEIQSCEELLGMEPEDLAAALGVEDEQAELLLDHCRGIVSEVDAGADLRDDSEPLSPAPPAVPEPPAAATPTAPTLTPEQKAKFNELVMEARVKVGEGHHTAALALYEASQLIHETEKVQRRMAKLREIIDTMVVHGDGFVENKIDGTCWLDDEFTIPASTHSKLFPHQREGVKWFWGLHRGGSDDREAEQLYRENGVRNGGILGDDMGLGKTVQVATFLAGILAEEDDHAATALLVMPVSLLTNWEKELKIWAPELRVETFHGSSKVQRGKAARAIRQNGGVLLTTYGLVASATAELNGETQTFQWDYMILDEGHKIKRYS